jgi:hypothetical protein
MEEQLKHYQRPVLRLRLGAMLAGPSAPGPLALPLSHSCAAARASRWTRAMSAGMSWGTAAGVSHLLFCGIAGRSDIPGARHYETRDRLNLVPWECSVEIRRSMWRFFLPLLRVPGLAETLGCFPMGDVNRVQKIEHLPR